MLVRMIYLALIVASVSSEQCDETGILIYEDLGCTPEYGTNKTCAIRYSCKGQEPSPTQCHFRGKTYEDREQIDTNLTWSLCVPSCSCDGGQGFDCAILDCPEEEGWEDYLKPGCYLNYTLDGCCAAGQICPPFDNIEKCSVDGKEYREGERFYPSNTCYECVCQKGFKGKFEQPFCKRRLCGQQLRNFAKSIESSCAAFYSNDTRNGVELCCPDDWLCPDPSDVIKGDAKSEESCNFGDKKVKVGQHFERLNFVNSFNHKFGRVKCDCVIPPLMTCIEV